MAVHRLISDENEFVQCPRRGQIDVEWCLGCPYRTGQATDGDAVVIVCDPPECFEGSSASLRFLPDQWRTH